MIIQILTIEDFYDSLPVKGKCVYNNIEYKYCWESIEQDNTYPQFGVYPLETEMDKPYWWESQKPLAVTDRVELHETCVIPKDLECVLGVFA